MTTKHTPRPWRVDRDSGVDVHTAATGKPVATVYFTMFEPEPHRRTPTAEAEANARLIAAAPDLYAALDGLLGFLDTYRHPLSADISDYLREAEAALGKADLKAD